jgi:hypothetical protein
VLGVGEEQPALDAQHDEPRGRLILGMAFDVDPVVAPSAHAAERRHVRARRAVDEQHERDRDAEE